ncbi:MinD/ParA family ATP-binding protein [Nocardia alba]|uniref:MinD-like ATPase involved in chromosome partitioning or flagellar assembly n=1 Tax=Nocardia alba TaxID=225051 RepID=A0A4R1FHX5_9NOCA|nr:MinD/ParA family protein [Nocardia alba]TCJ94367.1 MinD-like ATPase involved in chromosome partitioning or flagellar assembly [Nocardia alba]
MSRNNDSLPMLPPWLSESDVTQVGYEAPVENLPQDDEIDEAPKRRRFMGGRGDDASRKEKGRRRRKEREPEDEAAARPGGHADQQRTAEPTPQAGSGWSTPQQPADPLIPGPSHQQPRYEEPRPQPTYDQPTRGDDRGAAQYQQPHQPPPAQPNAGWQAAPNPLNPPIGAPPAAADPAPRPVAGDPSPIPGPSAADPAPWAGGQASTTTPPWSTTQPPAVHPPTPIDTPPPLPPTAGPTHAGPATPTSEADHAANALPTRTPAPPSTGFTPLGPNQQRPDLPPPPPLPDPPARPTQAPPRLTVPTQATESRPVAAQQPGHTSEPIAAAQPVAQVGHASEPVATPSELGIPVTEASSTTASSRIEQSAEVAPHPAPAIHEAEQTAPPRRAVAEVPESSTTTTESGDSPTSGARHSVGGWSMPAEDAAANTPRPDAAQPTVADPRPTAVAATTAEPQPTRDSFAEPTQPPEPAERDVSTPHSGPASPTHPGTDPRSEIGSRSSQAIGESVSQPQTPDRSTAEASSDIRPTGESAPRHGSPYSSDESALAQHSPVAEQRSPYASGEQVPPSTYPGTQYNSVPGDPVPAVPTHAPDGQTEVVRSDDPRLRTRVPSSEASRGGGAEPTRAAQTGYRAGEFVQAADAASPYPRPDGTPAQHQQPDGLPTYGPDGVAQRPDGAPPRHRPDSAPAQQPAGTPVPQYQQPNQGAHQQFPPNGPAPQYLPDGTPAPQYQQPQGPGPQYQQPQGPGPQYQPDGTPAPQYQQPQGTGPQYQQPNAPQQYQQPGNYQQGQQQPYGQPGWGAQPQGYQPSLDDVPLKRAKKAPGSGWRKAVHHVSGGAINPGMSAEELRLQELVARIRQPVRGDYRIAVLSLKGGVGKTTTTTGLGSIFASIRGDRVIAVDANPDFGTLSQRVAIQTRSTVRDLLLDPAIQRYSDVRRHTSQGSSRLEVLASERDPAASEAFNDEEYRAVARILQRFYNIILTDCGTGLMHSAMSGVLDLAHSLVLISSAAIDGARSAAATLDWLSLHGHDHLVRNAVVVINLPREGSPNVGVQQLREYFLSRCRAVHIIPFDEHLSEGAEIDLHRLHKSTKRAYVELAATVADEFSVHHNRLG